MRNWKLGLVALAFGGAPFIAVGQTPQKVDKVTIEAAATKAREIPVETFFRRPEFQQMALSPNGERLGALVPFKGRDNLVVIDLAKRTRQVITSFEEVDVVGFQWINNERLVLRVADGRDVLGRVSYRGTYAINWDATELRDLSSVGGRSVSLSVLQRSFNDSPEVIVTMNERTREYTDVYRFNTKNGRFQLLSFDSPGKTTGWLVDWNGIPKVAFRNEDKGLTTSVWVRATEEAKWEKISEYAQGDESITPIAFDFDNKTLFVSSDVGRDKAAIYKYDIASKKMGELVFEHPLIDVTGGLIFNRADKKLVGIGYSAEKTTVKWFQPEIEALQKQMDATLPGKINRISFGGDNPKQMLVYSSSDTDPGEYVLFNSEKRTLEPISKTQPWLNPALMSTRKFIKYKARDGMEIPAWITIPKGSEGKNLPLVVNIHGGPWVRSYYDTQWGRRPEAQFLASRGYLVLEPEPRASSGFGRKLLNAGQRQYGLTMQDDITDGVLHLVKEGLADKNKVCLFGASYGGYATLMGLAKEPDMFKCGVATVALVDLETYITITYADYSEGTEGADDPYFKRWVGDLRSEKKKINETSPNYVAAKIKAPVMLTMGSDDRRVPLIQGEKMRDAIRDAGGKVDWKVYTGEGHGFNKDENSFDFYVRTEKFLAEHLK
jgi:dipeptidyl aminopeptidase/acylaminoacyl peptidase